MGSCLQLQDLGISLNELWNLMQTPLEEQQQFEHITCNIEVIEEDITVPGSLALDIIDKVSMNSLLFHWQFLCFPSMKLILRIHSLLTLSVGVAHLVDVGRNRSCKA
jgi:hypothetical protein